MLSKLIAAICLTSSLLALECSKPVTLPSVYFDSPIQIVANQHGKIVVIEDNSIHKGMPPVFYSCNDGIFSRVEIPETSNNCCSLMQSQLRDDGSISRYWVEFNDHWQANIFYSVNNGDAPWSGKENLAEMYVDHIPYGFYDEIALLQNGNIAFITAELNGKTSNGDPIRQLVVNEINPERTRRQKKHLISGKTIGYYRMLKTHFDANGEGVLVWKRTNDKEINEMECSFYTNECWSSPQKITDLSEYSRVSIVGAFSPSSGNCITVSSLAEEGRLATKAVIINTIHEGVSSSFDIPLRSSMEYGFAMTRRGDAIAAVETRQDEDGIIIAFKSSDGAWSRDVSLPVNRGKNRCPQILPHGDDSFLVVWENQSQASKKCIYASLFSADTKTWSEPLQLSPSNHECYKPTCTITSDGTGIVAWHAAGKSDSTIQVCELTP